MKVMRYVMIIVLVPVFFAIFTFFLLDTGGADPEIDADYSKGEIARDDEYERVVAILKSETLEDDILERMFGAGLVDIQHYQEAYDDSSYLWSGFYANKYSIKYSQPLKRLASGHFAIETEGSGKICMATVVEKIFRDADGRVRILYGESRRFSVEDLKAYNERPADFLNDLGFDFEEGSINLREFGLQASGL